MSVVAWYAPSATEIARDAIDLAQLMCVSSETMVDSGSDMTRDAIDTAQLPRESIAVAGL